MDSEKLKQELVKKYEEVIKEAEKQADWYVINKDRKKKWARFIKAFAIVATGLGGLIPILQVIFPSGKQLSALQTPGSEQVWHFSIDPNYGYLLLAISGILILFDKYFGLSSGWIRYITTELGIRKKIRELKFNWMIEINKYNYCAVILDCTQAEALLNILKDFTIKVDELVNQETSAWAAEFQTNLGDLQKTIDSKMDSMKPGSIKIVLKNPAGYEKIYVKINNSPVKEIKGSESLIDNVPPGPYEILVEAVKTADSSQVVRNKVVQVEPNKMVVAELEF
jgi:hypothetical protein